MHNNVSIPTSVMIIPTLLLASLLEADPVLASEMPMMMMMLRRMSSSREVTWAGTSGEEGRTLSWELGGLCCAGEGGAGEPEELAAS